MTVLTSEQQELIRKRPQSTRLNLVIFNPRIVFQAQINNGSSARGDRTIVYDNVTLGVYTAIEAGMTMFIGSTPGGKDIGAIRVRSATSSQIVVSENSNVNWQNDQYLTVSRQFDLWPVYPRIIQDPSDAEQVIFYKDYDIAYTNQNTILGTFVCMGPHRTALISGSATQIYWSSTGTYNLLGNSLTYNWSFEGGTPTGSSSANPGLVSYSTAGDYVTRLIVTSSSGAVDTSYRYTSIRNRIGEGSNTPVVRWTMDVLDGSRDEGGYSVQITVFDSVSIDDNTVIMLVSDDWYGDTHQSFGGNYPNANSIFFVGCIEKDTIQYNYGTSFVKFQAVSLTRLMKDSIGFSVSVESKSAPSTWYELLDMDVRRALYHYLKWHTTVLSIADVQFVGQDYKIQYFDSDRTSMYDAVDNIMRSALVGKAVSDRQGKIWTEVTAEAYPNPTGTFLAIFEISKRDWMGTPDIDEHLADEFSYIEMDGIQYSGVVTGTYAALIGCAPGSAPSFHGKIEKMSGLAIGGQTQLNQMAGNVFANRNSRYPTINMQMANNLSNLDIAPQESNRVVVTPSDTIRNISLDGLYQPNSVSWNYDAKNGLLLPRIILKNLVSGITGESIIIPATPDDGGLNNGFNIPSLNIPNIPPFNPFITSNILGAIKFENTSQVLNPGFDFGPARLLLPSFVVGEVFTYGSATGTFATNITANRTGVYLITVKQHTEGTIVGSGGGTTNFVEPGVMINGSLSFPNSQRVSIGSTVAPTTVGYEVDNEYADIYYLLAGDLVGAYYQAASNTVSEILVSLSAILLYAV